MLSSSEEMREEAFLLGAIGFIRKTTSDLTLRKQMEQVLSSLVYSEN
jgi:hypothetical protein